jgi:hypothetical protein
MCCPGSTSAPRVQNTSLSGFQWDFVGGNNDLPPPIHRLSRHDLEMLRTLCGEITYHVVPFEYCALITKLSIFDEASNIPLRFPPKTQECFGLRRDEKAVVLNGQERGLTPYLSPAAMNSGPVAS